MSLYSKAVMGLAERKAVGVSLVFGDPVICRVRPRYGGKGKSYRESTGGTPCRLVPIQSLFYISQKERIYA